MVYWQNKKRIMGVSNSRWWTSTLIKVCLVLLLNSQSNLNLFHSLQRGQPLCLVSCCSLFTINRDQFIAFLQENNYKVPALKCYKCLYFTLGNGFLQRCQWNRYCFIKFVSRLYYYVVFILAWDEYLFR